jgi:hypothetical protein
MIETNGSASSCDNGQNGGACSREGATSGFAAMRRVLNAVHPVNDCNRPKWVVIKPER